MLLGFKRTAKAPSCRFLPMILPEYCLFIDGGENEEKSSSEMNILGNLEHF